MSIAVPVGAAVGVAAIPMKVGLNEAVEHVTGLQTGNAGYQQAPNCNSGECQPQLEIPESEKRTTIFFGPLIEETVFRGLPSAVLDAVEGNKKPAYQLSESRLEFSRKEVITGIVSSLAFGAVHNYTDKGFNTHTVPASQTFGGILYWWLQRKFGFFSNLTAHMTNNLYAVHSGK